MTTKRRFKVDKLIRDRMPDILGSLNIGIFERVLEQAEYIERLKDKLLEEKKKLFQAAICQMNLVNSLTKIGVLGILMINVLLIFAVHSWYRCCFELRPKQISLLVQ